MNRLENMSALLLSSSSPRGVSKEPSVSTHPLGCAYFIFKSGGCI